MRGEEPRSWCFEIYATGYGMRGAVWVWCGFWIVGGWGLVWVMGIIDVSYVDVWVQGHLGYFESFGCGR